MARIIYPTLQGPVLTQAQEPEQVTESRWHQPWSEPVRFKIMPALAIALAAASGNSFAPFPIPNAFPFADKYWFRFEEPVRLKPGIAAGLQQTLALVEAAPFTETTTESRWHQPWSEPSVKAKIGLSAASQQAAAYIGAGPFPEPPVYAKFGFGWSEPVRIKPGLRPELQLSAVWLFYESPQVDKWIYQYTDPVRIKPGLKAPYHPAFPAFVEAAPFPEAVLESKWHAAWSEPVRVKPMLMVDDQPVAAQTIFPPPPVDRYLFPFAEPVRLKPGLHASQQPWAPYLVIVPIFPNPRLTMRNIVVRIRLLGPDKSTVTV